MKNEAAALYVDERKARNEFAWKPIELAQNIYWVWHLFSFLLASQLHDSGNIIAAAVRCSLLSYFCVFSIDINVLDMRSHGSVQVWLCSNVIANVQKPVKLKRNEKSSLQKFMWFLFTGCEHSCWMSGISNRHLIDIFYIEKILWM